jgi:hypothetical protein
MLRLYHNYQIKSHESTRMEEFFVDVAQHWVSSRINSNSKCSCVRMTLKGHARHKNIISSHFLFFHLCCSVMLFIVGLPVAQIILFCLAIGHDPTGLPIAVTNHELSASLLAQQECPLYSGCNNTLLSCRYLEFLKNRSVVVVS